MNKKSIFFIVLLLAISIPLGLWYWKRQKASATDKKVDAVLPPITPPVGPQSPIDPASGLGALVVQKRIEQIEDSGGAAILADSFDYWKKVWSGVKATDFFKSNLTAALPLVLSDKQKAVLLEGEKLKINPSSDNWKKVAFAQSWFLAFQSAFSLSLIKENMYDLKNLNPFVDDYFDGLYSNVPNNKKSYTPNEFKQDIERMYADIAKFSTNYSDTAKSFYAVIYDSAIQDLRKAGYKFVGYDA
jgi:hypothetical protein